VSLRRFPWDAARSGVDAVISVIAALAWGFAAFIFGARFFSPVAGGFLGLAVLASALAMVLAMHLRDRRLLALTRGVCPSCRAPIASEHRHRRWDPERSAWRTPETAWECRFCCFAHSESWECPECRRLEVGG